MTNRDRRTGLPFYGYFSDLERLFEAVPGLASARIDMAFIDLAGFGSFNNAFGMAKGDEVLRAFAQALARIPGSMAIRDGGDEFIVLGTPTGTGLPERMAAFRDTWAAEFSATYGQGVVAPRILTMTTAGAGSSRPATSSESGSPTSRTKSTMWGRSASSAIFGGLTPRG